MHRHPDAPRGGPGAAHRRGPLHRRPRHPGRAAPRRRCAARTPTPASPASTSAAALGHAGRRRRLHRRRPPDAWAAPMPCAWAVTEDMKNPPHYPLAVDRPRYVGDGVAVRARHAARPRPATPLEAIVVDYEPLPAVVDLEDARCRPRARPRRPRHQHVLHVGAEDRRGGRRRRLRQRRPHGQGALRPAAPHPDGHGATGRAPRCPSPSAATSRSTRPPRSPTSSRSWRRSRSASPSSQVRVVAPSVGGGFGSKLDVYAEELLCVALARKHRVPGALGRGAHRERAGHHPGPRPDPGHRAGRRRRRQAHRRPGQPRRRHGRLPAARHAGHPAARRLPLRRRLRPAGRPTRSAAPACSRR